LQTTKYGDDGRITDLTDSKTCVKMKIIRLQLIMKNRAWWTTHKQTRLW